MTTRRLLTIAALIVFSGSGCGPSNRIRIPLVRMTGVVTLDDKPLEKAVVIFESPDGSFAYGATDRSGIYDLRFDSETRGVSIGMKTVRISMNRRIKGLNSFDEGGPEDRAGGSFERQPPERVPEKYNSKSELMATVTSSSRRFDFALSTKEDGP